MGIEDVCQHCCKSVWFPFDHLRMNTSVHWNCEHCNQLIAVIDLTVIYAGKNMNFISRNKGRVKGE